MRIFLVVGETPFYLPNFLASFLAQTQDQVVGAALVTKVPAKNNMSWYLMKHWYYLRPGEILALSLTHLWSKFLNRLFPHGRNGIFYSVRAAFEKFKIDYFTVECDINQDSCLERIRAKNPDVIVSSNPLIFKNELLRLPAICCINRHSALLPAYGGLWPVFHAFRAGEPCVGATVHTMEKKIDGGITLAQREVPIQPEDTIAELYQKTYDASLETLLEALDKIRRRDFSPVTLDGLTPSYFSFPTREHWRQFRARGGRFI
jgi:methionyl-tRNA formyltransferase